MLRFSYASLHLSLIAALGVAALTVAVSAGEPADTIFMYQTVAASADI